MATTEEKIRIIIDGDADRAKKAISDVGFSFKGLMKIFGAGLLAGGAMELVRKGFDAISGAIKGTINFIKGSIEAAAEEQLQITKLNTALKSTKNYTDEVSKSLIDYAAELQNSTMYADDAVIGVEAMLATFKLNNEEIKIATQATLDLAAATGQDLQSAAILMGKAMVGETGMLKRYGIMVDENKYAAEGWKAVIEEINTEFGGQAVAQADTYTGKIAQMKNRFDDIKESIGNAFMPVLEKLMDKFGSSGGVLETFSDWIGNIADNVGRFLESNWDSISGAVDTIFGVIQNILSGTEQIMTFFTGEENADLTFGEKLLKYWDTEIMPELKKKFGAAWEGMGEWIDENKGTIEGWGTKIGEFLGGMIASGLALMLGTKLEEDTSPLVEAGRVIGTSIVESIQEVLKEKLEGIFTTENIFNFAKGTWKHATVWGFIKDISGFDLEEGVNLKFMPFIDDAEKGATLKEIGDITNKDIPRDVAFDFVDEKGKQAEDAIGTIQEEIDGMEGKDILITITTRHINEYINQGSPGPSSPYSPPFTKASGGYIFDNTFAKDLSIPLIKGEAVLPASVVRAIKQSQPSFAGLDASGGGSITNQFNISELVVREEADISRIAESLYNMQQTRARLA